MNKPPLLIDDLIEQLLILKQEHGNIPVACEVDIWEDTGEFGEYETWYPQIKYVDPESITEGTEDTGPTYCNSKYELDRATMPIVVLK